jgi:hypothetical protein
MGRQTLDRERPGDADLFLVVVGLVVEIFKLRLSGDGGVDLLLPRNPRLPPLGMQLLRLGRPLGIRLVRDFPFLKVFLPVLADS